MRARSRQQYGTVHEEMEIERRHRVDAAATCGNFDEPLGDEAAFPTFLIAEQARRHVTVALAGDGGDEAFAGYERYVAHRLAGRIPGPSARGGARRCGSSRRHDGSRAHGSSGRRASSTLRRRPPAGATRA